MPGPVDVQYSAAGRWVVSYAAAGGHDYLRLWDLTAPPGAGPLVLWTKAVSLQVGDTDPLDRGCAAIDYGSKRLLFWPLPRSQSRVFEWPEGAITSVAFTADGTTLVASTFFGALRAWPLSADAVAPFRILPKASGWAGGLAAAPTRREIVVGSASGRVQVTPVDGGDPRELKGLPGNAPAVVAISPDGRRVAAAPTMSRAKDKRIHVWDLETGAAQILEPVPGADDSEKGEFRGLSFVDNDRIVATVNGTGLMLFDARDGKGKVLSSAIKNDIAIDRSGRVGVGLSCQAKSFACEVFRFGLDGGAPVPLPYRAASVSLDPSGTVLASAGPEGTVQIGPISGEEPHFFFGHSGEINNLAFSPDGTWLASAGMDETVRLWPVPDMKEVPPHKRSHEEFLATLKTFTNVRAVPDPKSPNGWKLEPGPFRGWKTAPHW